MTVEEPARERRLVVAGLLRRGVGPRAERGARLEHDALAWLTDSELDGLVLADPRLPELLRAALHSAPRQAWGPGRAG